MNEKLASDLEKLIWDELESKFPSFSLSIPVWKFIYHEYQYDGYNPQGDEEYWDYRCNLFLLILASEGKQIHWD